MNIHRSAHVHDTRREQRKEATTRSGATAPTERHCADKARHQKGSKTKSPLCVVLKTYHLTGNHHKTCLKHSNFLNRKLCVQLLPTWNTMATARGQGTEGKTKIRQNELRQGSKHDNYNILASRLTRPTYRHSQHHFNRVVHKSHTRM